MARTMSIYRPKIRNYTQVIFFDGIDDFVDLGTSGPIAAAQAAFSCACFFKREKLTGINAMVGDNNNSAQNHFNFQTQGANRKLLISLITTSGLRPLVGAANMPLYATCHAVFTYDGTTLTWYYNGRFDISTTHSGTLVASTAGMLIGTGSAPIGGAYRFFGGYMADLKFWDRALSAAEVSSLYYEADNSTSLRTGLQSEWSLAGNVLDPVGGNNGTVTGATYSSTNVPFKDRVTTSGRVTEVNRILIN